MKTAINSDHIWDMLKRRSTSQLNFRRLRRSVSRRFVALSARRKQR
ncbi:hypothetical protein [Cerasicoccus arenae]|nr:hypothetical protein [Cerasicoccus arenae]